MTVLRLQIDGPEVVTADVESGPHVREPDSSAGARALVREAEAAPSERALGQRRYEVVLDGWRFEVTAEPASRAELRERASASVAGGVHAREAIRARIPGRIVRVWVSPGEQVEAGQRLVAIEAMKMENEVRATHVGTVEAVQVELGQTVELGDELVVIA